LPKQCYYFLEFGTLFIKIKILNFSVLLHFALERSVKMTHLFDKINLPYLKECPNNKHLKQINIHS